MLTKPNFPKKFQYKCLSIFHNFKKLRAYLPLKNIKIHIFPLFRTFSPLALEFSQETEHNAKKPGFFKAGLLHFQSFEPIFCIPKSTFSGVTGKERTRTPVAAATAAVTAGAPVLMTTSPMDFAPKGPLGS